jgi:hypothetical protein
MPRRLLHYLGALRPQPRRAPGESPMTTPGKPSDLGVWPGLTKPMLDYMVESIGDLISSV